MSSDFDVCIKEIDLNETDIIKVKNEVNILKSIHHPYIVKYLDDFQIDQKIYIVMEMIEGGTLANYIEEYKIKNEKIPEEIIKRIFSQLVSVLKYCHDHQIVHKDIKSNNILYSKSGDVKLADFGLSKIIPSGKEEIEPHNSSAGSTPYVSPEILGQNPYSYSTDIWSLGVVIYELMTLEYPFYDSDYHLLYHQIMNEEEDVPEINEDYSEELKEIVYHMLKKDQSARINMYTLSSNPIFF